MGAGQGDVCIISDGTLVILAVHSLLLGGVLSVMKLLGQALLWHQDEHKMCTQ